MHNRKHTWSEQTVEKIEKKRQEIEENDVLSKPRNSTTVSRLHQTETSSIGSRLVVGNFLLMYFGDNFDYSKDTRYEKLE